MRWTWDQDKAAANLRDHHLSFETAAHVFEDPLHLSRPDAHPDGDRWQTVGLIGPVVVLVVHTWPDEDPQGGEAVGRMISARKATPRERKAYEEADW
ncbi:MAG TPA: BrnT family toxin [Stellaceae bacterium]|nr:BrnT family toxin [Stellaceae bacterium]